ncbi:MAG TPA: MiaB/RimO family radical SAM methylthiotransferase [Candidatus Polarisedimenticolia bacterium]|nr:MiaB/RimO family radical SAM methylthiotransferase [Candidatus Polarisedimenticolia bacterium]
MIGGERRARGAPTYRIVTLGCKLNQADSAALEARLRRLGMRRAAENPAPGGAHRPEQDAGVDLVLLNTCTVTGGADREARQIARRLRRANPGATLVVTGCYAERDAEALRRIAGVDAVVGMADQAGRVETIARAALGLAGPAAPAARPASSPGAAPGLDLGRFGETIACDPAERDRTRAFLKIQDGCDLRCSYCVIPSVRGASRSLPAPMVLDRLAALAGAGYREVVLTGVNTGDWGGDFDPPDRLEHLLARALDRGDVARLRLNSLEPRTVSERIASLLAGGKGRLARHLQVPLQSGCDTVLARMRRNYRSAEYARVLERVRSAVPDAALGADVIVGFPGETDAEFESTCRFIEASPLAYLHVFPYSERPGTAAASLGDRVPPPVMAARGARLRALGGALSLRFRRRFVGRTLEVLALREVRPDGRVRALSDNFIDCGLDAGGRDAGDLFNRLVSARITAVDEAGTLAEVA